MYLFFRSIPPGLLAVLVGIAAFGAIDPNHQYWITVFPDEAEHAGLAFGILALAAASVPKVPVWLLAAPLILAGSGLELLQGAGLIAGQFEWRDAGANVLGVGAAAFGLGCAELRRRGRAADERRLQQPGR